MSVSSDFSSSIQTLQTGRLKADTKKKNSVKTNRSYKGNDLLGLSFTREVFVECLDLDCTDIPLVLISAVR